MKMEHILSEIRTLACSQGFYGRLYNAIMELKEEDKQGFNDLKKELESKKFRDTLDIVYYFES